MAVILLVVAACFRYCSETYALTFAILWMYSSCAHEIILQLREYVHEGSKIFINIFNLYAMPSTGTQRRNSRNAWSANLYWCSKTIGNVLLLSTPFILILYIFLCNGCTVQFKKSNVLLWSFGRISLKYGKCMLSLAFSFIIVCKICKMLFFYIALRYAQLNLNDSQVMNPKEPPKFLSVQSYC